jgi:hypothetical protein
MTKQHDKDDRPAGHDLNDRHPGSTPPHAAHATRFFGDRTSSGVRQTPLRTMHATRFPWRTIAVWGILILVVMVAIAAGWRGLRREMSRQQGVEGFEVFLQGKDICTLAFEDGVVWAGGIDGLFRLQRPGAAKSDTSGGDAQSTTDDGSGSGMGDDRSPSHEVTEVGDFRQVKAVLVTKDGLWVGHDAGLSLIQGDVIHTLTTADGLPDDRVNALCMDSDEQLWAGTWGGVAILDGGHVERVLRAADGLLDDMVNVILADSSGSVWLGSYVAPRGGLTVLDGAKMQAFTTENGLLHSNINAIMETSEKVVLVGGGLYTKGGGTFFAHDEGAWRIVTSIGKQDGLAGEKIRALYEDSRGRIWAGSEYDGLVVFEGLTVRNPDGLHVAGKRLLTQETGLPNNEVKVVGEDGRRDIWVGTRSGLLKIEEGG